MFVVYRMRSRRSNHILRQTGSQPPMLTHHRGDNRSQILERNPLIVTRYLLELTRLFHFLPRLEFAKNIQTFLKHEHFMGCYIVASRGADRYRRICTLQYSSRTSNDTALGGATAV